MSKQANESDQTELPTRRRLRDARRRGEVAKSKELTSTAGLAAWVAIFALAAPFAYGELAGLFALVFDAAPRPSAAAMLRVGEASLRALLVVSVPLLALAGLAGMAMEFVQAGGLFAPQRLAPDAGRLNPVAGVKKMFSQQNLVELAKAAVKTLAVLAMVGAVAWSGAGALLRLPEARPAAVGEAIGALVLAAGAATAFAFFGLSFLDWLYQRHAFLKERRMSRREIRREAREDEGDPQLKARRRQLHQEWATRNVLESVKTASVVVTNPTHVAVALLYEPGDTPVPVVAAKGEDHLARLIRETAEAAGVPILRNVALARGLNERVEVDEYIPAEFFEAVAEVLRWAASVRDNP
jgi:type III secretion protein U